MTIAGNNSGGVQLTTVQSSTSTKFEMMTIGDTAYPYMRAKTVTFTVSGLKPNTEYFPFFNNAYVGAYCSTVSPPTITNGAVDTAHRTLKTDALGNMVGNFYLPANTFVSGSHIFKLVDAIKTINGGTVPDPMYGSAEASYEANGTLKNMQTQVTTNLNTNVNVAGGTGGAPVLTSTSNSPTQPVAPSNPLPGPGAVITAINPSSPAQVSAPPKIQCETWYFEYTASSTAVASGATSAIGGLLAGLLGASGSTTYTLLSHSATPPTIASGSYTGTKIHSNIGGQTTYAHSYNRSGTSGAAPIFKQEWTGPTVTNVATQLPSLTNFTVPGLKNVTIVKGWTKKGSAVCPVKSGFQNLTSFLTPSRWFDPLAQSFTVDAAKYPDGMFLTKISVYFKTVDQTTPVLLQVREMTNGFPGSTILPRATVLKPGYTISGSPDASIPADFEFDTPIYLKPSTDYCFVLKSSSLGYNAWTSRLGEIDVYDGKVIDAQPYGGTLFKSENDVTWIPDSYEDLKFDLYKADFTTNIDGNLTFRPKIDTIINQYPDLGQVLPLTYMSTTKLSGVVTIKAPMHGLSSSTDKVYITGIAATDPVALGYNGIPASYLNGTHTATVIDQDTITITLTGITANRTGNLFVQEVPNLLHVTAATLPPSKSQVAAPPFADPTIMAPSTLNSASAQTLSQPLTPTLVSSSNFTIYTNLPFHECMIDYMGTEFPDTEIIETVYATTAKSDAGTEVPYAAPQAIELPERKDFHAFDEPHMIATPPNEAIHQISGSPLQSFSANLKLTTNSKDVTPIIDSDGLSVTVRSYKIDNQNDQIETIMASSGYLNAVANGTNLEDYFNDATTNSEIIPGKGAAAAKYKSTVNSLGSNFNDLELFVTGNCPAPAKIDAYIRASTDPSTHMDRNWIWAPIEGTYGTTFENSPNKLTMNQWIFRVPQSISEPFTIKTSDVAIGTEVIKINNHGLVTGNAVVYYARGGTALGGLTDGTTYYVIKVSTNEIKLAQTAALAAVPTPIDLTGTGNDNQQLLPQIGLGSFSVFDVKLVMRSTNSGIVPKIYSVRAIANNV